ncbi:MAG: four helix bundle protein [Planctomycetota bacterium]|nr:MAG: four helix bundle protein [Planctomycetota bacterium]
MKNKKPRDIRKRVFEYSLRAIKLYQSLQEGKDSVGWIISKQYLRSATAIGANMEEAQAGESRKDFIHKCSIALKEGRESLYWLRLLAESGIIAKERITPLIAETEELVAVIAKIIINTKKKK